MKHASTRALFEYWDRQRANRPAPARSDIEPGDIRHVLGDTFMLSADFIDELRFRLAGTRVCALFGREIKGETFTSFWGDSSRAQIADLLAAVENESIGIVAGVIGRTQNDAEVELEMLLLPIAASGQTRIRALGAIAPQVSPYWLGAEPLVDLELRTLRHIGAEQATSAEAGFGRRRASRRVRHGFLVYTGGRDFNPDEGTG
ncbi:MAG TPA: PAS domain-containing protein [Pseudolabrys sp.]|jgi:hypothetical protein|nr:PAS domain-containing protein [Pseudolabrys sp.]